jgi:glyoxylase I family protein
MANSISLDHLALPIVDVAGSLRFYGELLELPLVEAPSGEDWGGKPWLMMIFGLGDGRQLALVALRGAARPDDHGLPREVRHVAFSCASAHELAGWRERLTRHGVEMWEEDHGAQQSIYFVDPNGLVLEVTTPASAAAIPVRPAAIDEVRAWLSRKD